MKTIKLYNPRPSQYANKTKWGINGKSNIQYEYEPENKYDSEAIMVFTFKRDGEREDLGYIQKKEFIGYKYSDEFLKEFSDWENSVYEDFERDGCSSKIEHWMTYPPGKNWYYHNRWEGLDQENKYEYLYKEGELKEALEDISKGNMRYAYTADSRYGPGEHRELFNIND